MEGGDSDHFLRAVAAVARARGMAQLAKDAGVSRESLYKVFAPGAKPRYDTVAKLMHALELKIKIHAGG